MEIKKHSIGYNTVSSVDGVISAKGVKSKPNNIQFFGYTHEIGDGEKSPDNPYKLVSLDSNNMSVNGVEYEHSITLTNNNTTIQVPVPVALHSVNNISDTLIKKNDVWGIIKKNSVFSSNECIDNLKFNVFKNDGTIVYMLNYGSLAITPNDNVYMCKSNMLNIVSHSVDKNNIAKLYCNEKNKRIFIRYSQSEYPQFSSVETLREFLLKNPIEIIYPDKTENFIELSNYAQELLNSFTLQNNNKIWIEGYPDIKVGGYLQMR